MSGRKPCRPVKVKHRRFTDGAGFTRHCWECSNATDWDGKDGWCAAYDMHVTRYDSPNNICSVGRKCWSYYVEGEVVE